MARGGLHSEEHRKKFVAMAHRNRLKQRKKMADMARGAESYELGRHTGASIDITPAAWASARTEIGDCEFVDDGLDPILLRALHDRVVYAGSVTCHHSVPFQDLAIAAIAAAVRSDPSRNGRGPKKKGGVVKFTERQLTVIALIAEGCTNAQIAGALGISVRGAKLHSDVLREKLGVGSRHAIPAAYRNLTGKDPFASSTPAVPAFENREELPLVDVVPIDEEPIKIKGGYREGRSLTDVVGDMFRKEGA